MNKKGYLIGKTFHFLKVIKYLGNRKYECLCVCGNIRIVLGGNLLKGNIKSCGCKKTIHRSSYEDEMKEKLLSNIQEVNGCWEWQGARHKQGYGHFPYKRSVQLAHRISWRLFNGEIPRGMNVCHKCDNTSCVNPEHLFLGTQIQNMRDMFKKKRKNHQGENHPRVKLTQQQVLEIREMIKNGFTQEEVCRKYGITNGHVGSIRHRRTWKCI